MFNWGFKGLIKYNPHPKLIWDWIQGGGSQFDPESDAPLQIHCMNWQGLLETTTGEIATVFRSCISLASMRIQSLTRWAPGLIEQALLMSLRIICRLNNNNDIGGHQLNLLDRFPFLTTDKHANHSSFCFLFHFHRRFPPSQDRGDSAEDFRQLLPADLSIRPFHSFSCQGSTSLFFKPGVDGSCMSKTIWRATGSQPLASKF